MSSFKTLRFGKDRSWMRCRGVTTVQRFCGKYINSRLPVQRWGAFTLAMATMVGLAAQPGTIEVLPSSNAAAVAKIDSSSVKPSSTAAATNSGPKIQFAEAIHDFGRVEFGKILTNFFVFTNTGDQPLEIGEIISSCGCVAAQNWSRGAESGKSGTIPVIFSASGIVGTEIMKPIRITCNDPTQSNVVLYIQATIYKPIDAVPPIAAFSFGPDFQTNETRTIRLMSNMEEPVTLSEPVCTNRSFRAELKTITPGKE